MIGQSSSLIMRWASGVVRERFALATSSFFSFPIFNGLANNSQLLSPLQLSPCGATAAGILTPPAAGPENEINNDQHIWFAVPKSKISHSRKRMKTTRQMRIPLKKNIVFDPRTGEVTLKHRMPENWKDYLPKLDKTDWSLIDWTLIHWYIILQTDDDYDDGMVYTTFLEGQENWMLNAQLNEGKMKSALLCCYITNLRGIKRNEHEQRRRYGITIIMPQS